MSTHRFIKTRFRSIGVEALSALAAFLMILLLLLTSSSTTLAASVPFQLGQNEALDRAGVSVVRLLVSYTEAGTAKPDVQCTGLGVLVASWPSPAANTTTPNNWLLADGNLLNPNNGAACLPPNETKKLIPTVQIFYSDAYTAKTSIVETSVPSNPIPMTPDSVHCQDTTCKDSLALLGFHTDPAYTLPSIDLATGSQPQSDGLALTNASGQLAFSPVNTTPQVADFYKAGIAQSLTPNLVSSGQVNESWLPLVNSHGQLVGVQWSNATGNPTMTSTDIQNFLNNVPELKAPPANPLHDSWTSGVANYYNAHYSDAEKDFQTAFQLNQTFLGAQKMEQLAANPKPPANNPAAKNNSSESTGNPLGELLALWPWLLVVVMVVLVLLLAGNRLRSLIRQTGVNKDLKEAEQQASIEAERIKLQEEQQRQALLKQSTPPVPASAGAPPAPAPVSYQAQPDIHCPRCNTLVSNNAKNCPNCRLSLPTSASKTPVQTAPLRSGGVTKPLWTRARTANSLTEQTTTMLGDASNGATISQSFGISRSLSPRLGFTVATRSDPGIKRKYKPNEDSLMAARGTLMINKSPVPLGLFVVADGMGGHANGQDASRRAIQTIMEFMMPKIAKSSEMPPESLPHVLVEAVQHANQAVHQNNVELHADMGTTVTAAMIVGSTAYFANVGDSRTYLYREGEGLRKITNDHSVVASLVEAGIIKPDDIYTHPKRNQIYRSLGEKPVVEVDPFMERLQMGDKILLCSDGLWDMVRDPKIEEVIKAPRPETAMTADALIQAALEGGGEDNVSVIVVSIVEGTDQTVVSGVQLLDKPENLQMPEI